MEQAEIELLVSELETRMDRLRVLYEQYFMGFERVEPHVPKKDVERRVAVLRKEQIRNTGLRFKFHMILQRYSTYQTYWFRISRQIETGTYKRDVMRATARFGIDPTKEKSSDGAPDEAARGADATSPGAAQRSSQRDVVITDEEMAELEDGTAFLEPLDEEAPPSSAGVDDPFAPIASPASVAPPARERFASAVRLDLDDLGDPFEEHDPFPKPAVPLAPPSAPKIRIAQRGVSNAPKLPEDEHRDTERRIPVAPRVAIAKRQSIPDAGEVAGTPARPSIGLKGAGATGAAGAPPAPASTPRVVPGAPASNPRVVPAAPASSPRVGASAAVPAAPASTPRVTASPAVPSRAAPAIRPVTPAVASSAPRIAVAAPKALAADAPRAATPAVASRVAPAAVAKVAPVASRPAPAPKPAPAAAPAARPVGDMSGDRFGEIYTKYVATRREHNEPTHAITPDALAKQLSESTQRLKQKHGGKPIDFEVVVKDGKTILRPVVK